MKAVPEAEVVEVPALVAEADQNLRVRAAYPGFRSMPIYRDSKETRLEPIHSGWSIVDCEIGVYAAHAIETGLPSATRS